MESDAPDNSLQYQLTREEVFTQFWRLMLRPRLIFTMAFVFLCGVGVLILRDDDRPVALLFIGFPLLFFFFYRRMVHKIVAQHPEFLEAQTASFDASGITITNSVTRVRWPWSRIRGVTDSTDFYVFRFDTLGSGAIIPKRSLTTLQCERLLSYANAKVT